jgi:hypothetical protein
MSDVAEKLEAEATDIICRVILHLPGGVKNGTATQLVRCLVDAAVERVKAAAPAPSTPARTIGLPRKGAA